MLHALALAPLAILPVRASTTLQASASKPAAVDRAALERDFARRMTGAKLAGHFTDDTAPPESAPSEDTYELAKVEHLEGDRWRIEAGVAYGGKSFRFPIEVDVLWAGDTPVISLTDFAVPMLGSFTARVMFHGERYAGIWSGKEHGGAMFGRVLPAAATQDAPKSPAPAGSGKPAKAEDGTNWPSFRGENARGVAEGHPTADEFDVESGKNVRWRVETPGLAHSSPIVFGDRIYVTTAVREGGAAELKVGLYGDITSVPDEGEQDFRVLCFDKAKGELLWSRSAWKGHPRYPRHPKGSFAASTPATDGEHVVAFFGTEGLYAFDAAGELLWKKDFGELPAGFYMMPGAQWGFGSSPVIHDGKLLVQCDVIGKGFVAAFDVATGAELWRTERDDVPSWSSPTVVSRSGGEQVVCNGCKRAAGYALATGEELWYVVGGGDIPVPTPISAHDLVFLTSAHGPMAPIYAVDRDAKGQVERGTERMPWSETRRGNYMQTPLAYGEEIYFCNDAGVLACYDARTGEEHYRQRLGEGSSGFTASGVAADGKLYFTAESGTVHVVAAGADFEALSVNDLGEECMATPAISAGVIYWRSRGHLTAVEPD